MIKVLCFCVSSWVLNGDFRLENKGADKNLDWKKKNLDLSKCYFRFLRMQKKMQRGPTGNYKQIRLSWQDLENTRSLKVFFKIHTGIWNRELEPLVFSGTETFGCLQRHRVPPPPFLQPQQESGISFIISPVLQWRLPHCRPDLGGLATRLPCLPCIRIECERVAGSVLWRRSSSSETCHTRMMLAAMTAALPL